MSDPHNLYVGRKGSVFIDSERFPKHDSPYANPFKIGPEATREDVVRKYHEYIRENLDLIRQFKEEVREKQIKRLGCWCKPEQCHADILMEILMEP